MTDSEYPRYVVIEGPIGVGKTSLATRLADSLNADLVLERPEENPFLPRFYEDERSAALPTQLHFLFQRSRQVQEMRQADLFGSTGTLKSLWVVRMQHAARDTQGMIDELLTMDEPGDSAANQAWPAPPRRRGLLDT